VAVIGAAKPAEYQQVPQPAPQLAVTAAEIHEIIGIKLHRLIGLNRYGGL